MTRILSGLAICLIFASGSSQRCEDFCSATFKQVAYCLSDRNIYPNLCAASCNRRALDIEFVCHLERSTDLATCSRACKKLNTATPAFAFGQNRCPAAYRPVCYLHDISANYSNECMRKAINPVHWDTVVRCPLTEAGCAVSPIFDPQCGTNGVTYANPQLASCEGVKLVSRGECRKRKLTAYENNILHLNLEGVDFANLSGTNESI